MRALLLAALSHASAALSAAPPDCQRLVDPIDTPPIRSPLAVHSLIAHHARNKDIVEIGTRKGDGINCIARVTKSAIAVELDRGYCAVLRKRASELIAMRRGNYSVMCTDFRKGCPDADLYTWWQQGRSLENYRTLDFLNREQSAGRIRMSAEAVILFDHSWSHDLHSLQRLRPHLSWITNVSFDEVRLCHHLSARGVKNPLCRSRAQGKFSVGGIQIRDVNKIAQS